MYKVIEKKKKKKIKNGERGRGGGEKKGDIIKNKKE